MPELSPTNLRKLTQFESRKTEVLKQCLRPGFHGTIVFKIKVQDGTIQVTHRKLKEIDR